MTILKKDLQQQLQALIPFVTKAARLTAQEENQLARSLAAEIITVTAYLSGCYDPGRIIVSHLLTLVADIRTEGLFSHQPGESLAGRLRPGNYFPGGDSETVKAGMLLLELLSLRDHKADIAGDIVAGNQNPLIVDMDYQHEFDRIMDEYNRISFTIRKDFQRLLDEVINAGWWVL